MRWGFILHAALYGMSGRAREVSAAMWILAILSVGLLLIEHGGA